MRCAAIIFLATAAPALADPWLRESGQTFLSFGIEATEESGGANRQELGTMLLEFGLSDRLTFGLDLSGRDGDDWSALSYLRSPVGRTDGPGRASVSVGLGMRADPVSPSPGATEPVFLLGGAIGRSYDSALGDGWVSLEAEYRYRLDSAEDELKTDLTLGLNATPRVALIGQVQIGSSPGADPTARLSASVVGQLSDSVRAEVGLLYGVENDDTRGVKIGTWLDF